MAFERILQTGLQSAFGFRSLVRAAALLGLAGLAVAQPPTIGGCPVFPSDNIWNTRIDQLPVHPSSPTWVSTIGANLPLHPDYASATYGIPFITVPGTQTKFPASFLYQDESDPGPYAIPLDAPIEGGSASTGDRHVIAIETQNCLLYEMYYAFPQSVSWQAGSGAIFNLLSNALRPDSWTSTDAAGLPVFPGLVRVAEVQAGEIRHALRFTAPQTQKAHVWPARHDASSLTSLAYPPMGARFRLKANFDISGFSPNVQVILTALKRYGMMLADNGSSWFIQGEPNPLWNDTEMHTLTAIVGSNLEAGDVSPLIVNPDSGQALQASAPVTFNTIPAGLLVVVDNGTPQAAPFTLNLTGGLHNVVVNPTQSGKVGTQYVFTGWSDSGAVSHAITVGSVPLTYTATFKTQFQLTELISPSASGSLNLVNGAFYDAGTVVSVQASANPGYRFANFAGDVSGSKNPQQIPIYKPIRVIANFALAPPLLIAAVDSRVDGVPGITRRVTLSLTNAGVGAASNARITGISHIADVSGSGAVTVASGIPANFGTIDPGSSGSGVVIFNWPSTASRVGFTINFSADNDYSGTTVITTFR